MLTSANHAGPPVLTTEAVASVLAGTGLRLEITCDYQPWSGEWADIKWADNYGPAAKSRLLWCAELLEDAGYYAELRVEYPLHHHLVAWVEG